MRSLSVPSGPVARSFLQQCISSSVGLALSSYLLAKTADC